MLSTNRYAGRAGLTLSTMVRCFGVSLDQDGRKRLVLGSTVINVVKQGHGRCV
jgi:hypothetical protein